MLNEAFALKDEGRYAESIAKFKEAVAEFGENPNSVGMIAGMTYQYLKDPHQALPYAKRSIQLSPKSELASYTLVHILIDLEDQEAVNIEMRRYFSLGIPLKLYKVLLKGNRLTKEDFL